jgi:hypothetical protein
VRAEENPSRKSRRVLIFAGFLIPLTARLRFGVNAVDQIADVVNSFNFAG